MSEPNHQDGQGDEVTTGSDGTRDKGEPTEAQVEAFFEILSRGNLEEAKTHFSPEGGKFNYKLVYGAVLRNCLGENWLTFFEDDELDNLVELCKKLNPESNWKISQSQWKSYCKEFASHRSIIPSFEDDIDKDAFLFTMIYLNQAEILEALFEQQLFTPRDINDFSEASATCTPLSLAICCSEDGSHLAVMKSLVSLGADVNKLDHLGRSALAMAVVPLNLLDLENIFDSINDDSYDDSYDESDDESDEEEDKDKDSDDEVNNVSPEDLERLFYCVYESGNGEIDGSDADGGEHGETDDADDESDSEDSYDSDSSDGWRLLEKFETKLKKKAGDSKLAIVRWLLMETPADPNQVNGLNFKKSPIEDSDCDSDQNSDSDSLDSQEELFSRT